MSVVSHSKRWKIKYGSISDLVIFAPQWRMSLKNKLIKGHGDLFHKTNIGYLVLYFQKVLTCFPQF